MFGCHLRRCSIFRSLMPLFMLTYLLLLMLLLLNVHLDSPRDVSGDIRSPSVYYFYAKDIRVPVTFNQSHAQANVIADKSQNSIIGVSKDQHSSRIASDKSHDHTTIFQGKRVEFDFEEPNPLPLPLVDSGQADTFYTLQDDIFVYSAYYDDRKDDIFIRILALATQIASRSNVYCHFRDEIYNINRTAARYEMCENHNMKFGGYIFSCQVPDFLNRPLWTHVNISYNVSNTWVVVPLKTVRPSQHRLSYLDSYIGNMQPSPIFNDWKNNNIHYNKADIVSSHSKDTDKSDVDIIKDTHQKDGGQDSSAPLPPLSFAICVPPLFGRVSPHRLIEFIELSLLLGAEHIFFYIYSISDDIPAVLLHYVSNGVVTVTPWSLPRNVTSDKVWYNGQLLAHNDCLYRTMPRYDLVAFNDIDEFIVPHGNHSTDWLRAFSTLLSSSTCGFSFQSAFYDPGVKNTADTDLLTLALTTRTKKLSKVRSKVMLCPWRVFEVGIHHISKQNKEMWTVKPMDPSTAFLHHYRRCVVNYDMSCRQTTPDDVINQRYYPALTKNYDAAVAAILPHEDTLRLVLRPEIS